MGFYLGISYRITNHYWFGFLSPERNEILEVVPESLNYYRTLVTVTILFSGTMIN